MGKNLICLLILLLASNIFLNAQEYVVKEGSASFKAKTPLISYEGISNDVKGTIDFKAGTLTFSVPVKFIKTGNEKRDEHMYELVEAEKYPNIVFKGKFIGGFNFKRNETQSVQAKGDFSLAGTTRQINIPINLELVSEGTIQLNTSWSLLITDYNLERPSFAFIKVKDKHFLRVYVLLKEK